MASMYSRKFPAAPSGASDGAQMWTLPRPSRAARRAVMRNTQMCIRDSAVYMPVMTFEISSGERLASRMACSIAQ